MFSASFNNELPYKTKLKSDASCSNSFGPEIIFVLVKSFNLSVRDKKCPACMFVYFLQLSQHSVVGIMINLTGMYMNLIYKKV